MQLPKQFDPSSPAPVLIAGPTASGKSSLALELATHQPSIIVNADALQVYKGWNILTARPSKADLMQTPHALYGHVAMQTTYSVGHWLRDIQETLSKTPKRRPIIIGGTGLYFKALTRGLADIPAIDASTRQAADDMAERTGLTAFAIRLLEQDPAAAARIDMNNPVRTRRAWEVFHQTGKSITWWQDQTPPPIFPKDNTQTLLFEANTAWLKNRINRRFDRMVELGALEEARKARDTFWDPRTPSSQAIGAAEFIDHLNGHTSLETAIERSKVRTHQFAKRQRTWFRSQMRGWNVVKLK
ncbi:MAG: tRNA (adenosine(37)-N6)-dimethylallyltransferase MiaA [Pseudomonadota bacterium]